MTFDRLTRAQKRAIRTRNSMLRAAQTLFAERGFVNVTIAHITDMADVALGSFYNHFDNREHIIEAVLADLSLSQERFHASVARRFEPGPETAIVSRYVSTAQRCQLDPLWADLSEQATLIKRWPMPAMVDEVHHALSQLPDSESMAPDAQLDAEYAARLIVAVVRMLFDRERTNDLETETRVGLSSLLRALEFTDKATRHWVEAATAVPLDLESLADSRSQAYP